LTAGNVPPEHVPVMVAVATQPVAFDPTEFELEIEKLTRTSGEPFVTMLLHSFPSFVSAFVSA